MSQNIPTIRLLGAAQFTVFILSLLSERLLASAIRSESGTAILVNISSDLTRMRISNLLALLNSVAIVTLGGLFYSVLSEQNRTLALIAFGCFLAEAITLAISKLGAYGLTSLSRDFIAAGSPVSTELANLAEYLYYGVDRRGYDLHMLFFCLGGIVWYSLLYRSGVVPPALSVWGIAAVSLLTIPVLLLLYDRKLTQFMVLGLP